MGECQPAEVMDISKSRTHRILMETLLVRKLFARCMSHSWEEIKKHSENNLIKYLVIFLQEKQSFYNNLSPWMRLGSNIFQPNQNQFKQLLGMGEPFLYLFECSWDYRNV